MARKPSRTTVAAIALLSSAMAISAAKDSALAADVPVKAPPRAPVAGPKWHPWLEFGGYWSNERSRGEAVLWSPLWQSPTSLLFADFRGKLFEESVTEGNLALGFRHMLPNGWNLGLWAGYDVHRTAADNTFHQASVGLEALHANWDLRLNGYFALSDPKGSPGLAEVVLSGSQIFMIGGEEVPLSGVDGELGIRIPFVAAAAGDWRLPNHLSGLPKYELALYAGGFWFDDSEALREVAGPKARRVADQRDRAEPARFEARIRSGGASRRGARHRL